MNCQLSVVSHQLSPQRARARLRAGFSFTEVLFAVMVLGIGFIMIAAMFPVTIRQTQTTMEETQAANMAKEAMAYLQQIATDENFPPTVQGWDPTNPFTSPTVPPPAQFVSLTQVMYNPPLPAQQYAGYYAARGNFINTKNPRYAWVPIYKRGLYLVNGVWTPEPLAQVIMIQVQSRNRTEYTSLPQPTATPNVTWNDLDIDPLPSAAAPSFPAATLDAALVPVTLKFNAATQEGEMTFPGYATHLTARTATGAYVIIANDQTTGMVGRSNGRIYQLGPPVDEFNQIWNLTPGSEMVPQKGATIQPYEDNDINPGTPPNISTAYMIGRGYADMTQPHDILKADRGYLGPVQDIGIYTGFIQIRQP
jgi:Tfp pilus assembly protein PilV